jgi:hypothetical protein
MGTLELRNPGMLMFRPDARTQAKCGSDHDSDGDDKSSVVCCLVECSCEECGETYSLSGWYHPEKREYKNGPSSCMICWSRKITPSP